MQPTSPVTDYRIAQFASRDGGASSSSARFEDPEVAKRKLDRLESLEAELAELKRAKRG